VGDPGSSREKPGVEFDGGARSISLVCIHGLAGSSRWWEPVSQRLAEAGPVYPIDLPRTLRPSGFARWLVEQLERSHPDRRVDLAGHSLGALVALQVAAARPELVRKLILIAPPGLTPRRSAFTFGWPLISSLTKAEIRFLLLLARDAARAGPANILRGGRYVAGSHATAEAANVSAPTLLVFGAGDRLVPIGSARQWLDALPEARLHVISAAGHVPMVETPDELATVVNCFRKG
jgi:pimeloyl-ACP methyl ester carboxylesterase